MALLSARDYARLPTEQSNPRTRDIDRRSTREIVRLIAAEDARVPLAVAKVAGENVLRVMAGAEQTAASLRTSKHASEAVVEAAPAAPR